MIKQVIVMRTDLGMRKGKMIAQGAHASLDAYWEATSKDCITWAETGSTKVCVAVDSEAALFDINQAAQVTELPVHLVWDEGRTEFKGVRTATCLAIGPADGDAIDRITGKLKLL